MVKTKKFLCLFLAALMAFALFCGCTSSGKKDKDIQLSDYGLDEETVKEKYDFKSPAGNVYFRIVDELRVYEPGADIRYVVLADETLASETTVEVAFRTVPPRSTKRSRIRFRATRACMPARVCFKVRSTAYTK